MNVWYWLVRQLDLRGHADHPAFSKLMVVAVFVASLVTGTFSFSMALLLVAAAFGRSTLMALINRTSVQVDPAKELEALAKVIHARRDTTLGIEHTP